jgi:ribosomal protein S18 acetylase RimI-like enzyme
MTGEAIAIRRAGPGDVGPILDLWERERSQHASVPDSREAVEGLLAAGPAVLLVAESGGEVAGALIAAWDGWRGNLYRLAVRTDRRRQGIGSRLVAAGEEYLRSRGAARVTALVAFDDDVAAGFWDAAGYPLDRQIGRHVRNLAPE